MTKLKDEQIVYIGNDWRTDNRTSSHHIASRLARDNTLLYVEGAGGRTPRASTRDFRRIFARIGKWLKGVQPAERNVYVLSPILIPFHRFSIVNWFNRKLLQFTLRRALKGLGFVDPILWIVAPHYASVIDDLGARGLVYYCVDEYASLPNTDAAKTIEMEKKILERADVVFTVSEVLRDKKSAFNDNVNLVPHGVDTDHFAAAMNEETVVAEDMARIKGPIAGFFGLIEEWLDIGLVETAAKRLPDISFVFVGRIARDVSSVQLLPNVHFLGPRPYIDLPTYLKAFDVGLVPFELTDVILKSNPLKLKEYLAGGKPVVTVDIPAFEPYVDYLYLARNGDEFADHIVRAIEEDCEESRKARNEAMQPESWEAKFDFVSSTVRHHIPEKQK